MGTKKSTHRLHTLTSSKAYRDMLKAVTQQALNANCHRYSFDSTEHCCRYDDDYVSEHANCSTHYILPSPPLCDVVPRSLISLPLLTGYVRSTSFDMAGQLDAAPTGPPGKCQAAQSTPDRIYKSSEYFTRQSAEARGHRDIFKKWARQKAVT